MKQILSKIGLRLRSLRQSSQKTQEFMAAECRQHGFAISREKLAKYEIGMTQVPVRFVPIIAHVLKVQITDLLPPIGDEDEPKSTSPQVKIRNLSGPRIRFFRKKQKWTQHKLAAVLKEMGVLMTRDIIASVEMQRTRVRDYQLVLFAKALQIPLESLFPDKTDFADYANFFSSRHHLKSPLPFNDTKNHSAKNRLSK
jgi:transcriptional regulator with XRE-family HTH domain